MLRTAVESTLVMYALAGAISLLVAALIKGLFLLLRRFGGKGDRTADVRSP